MHEDQSAIKFYNEFVYLTILSSENCEIRINPTFKIKFTMRRPNKETIISDDEEEHHIFQKISKIPKPKEIKF